MALVLCLLAFCGCGNSSYVFTGTFTDPGTPTTTTAPQPNDDNDANPTPVAPPTSEVSDQGFNPELDFADPCLEPFLAAMSETALSAQFAIEPGFDPAQTPPSLQPLNIERVSTSENGLSGLGSNAWVKFPVITGSGNQIIFSANAKNLAYGNSSRAFLPASDFAFFLFARDIVSSTTKYIETEPTDDFTTEDSTRGTFFPDHIPAVSSDGRYIAFTTSASLLPEDQNGNDFARDDIYRLDRQSGELILITQDSTGTAVGGARPSISADGNIVAFDSGGDELLPPGVDGNVFVRDVTTGTTEVVGPGFLFSKCVSADGNRIVYYAPADPVNPDFRLTTVYLYDRTTRQTSVASPHPPGTSGTTDHPSISADGNTVVFSSFASALDPSDQNDVDDVFAYDIDTGVLERLSISASGEEGDNFSGEKGIAVSGDGRFVAFTSEAENLVPDDDNGRIDLFLVDRELDTIRRVNVGPNGESPNAVIEKREEDDLLDIYLEDGPSISDDGRYLTFASNANNLVDNDVNRGWDVFLYDTSNGTLTLQSRRDDGQQPYRDGKSYSSVLSATGRFVAFNTYTDLFADLPEFLVYSFFEGMPFFRDMKDNALELMLVTETGELYGSLDSPAVNQPFNDASLNGFVGSISDDGSTVGFFTCERLAERDEDYTVIPLQGVCNVDSYIYKAQSKTTEIISVDPSGENAAPAYFPSVSADGTLVAFSTRNNNIDPLVNIDKYSVFTRDRLMGCLQLQSVGRDGAAPDADVYEVRISGDGRFLGFTSASTNLVSGTDDAVGRVYLRELSTGATINASPTIDGNSPDGESRFGEFGIVGNMVSTTGRYVVYESVATNLVTEDNNGARDIFVFDLGTRAVTRITETPAGGNSNGDSQRPNISGDGRYIVFSSLADNLVLDDNNGVEDIFVFDQLTGLMALVSRNPQGAPANGPSVYPAISRDGRYISYSSRAGDINIDDTNMTSDVFRVRNPLSL